MIMLSDNEIPGNTIEIEGRERGWTPTFLKKKKNLLNCFNLNRDSRVECVDAILSQ